jgi:3-phosphoshikimate 1-carboxyvinyltransferase
VLGAQVSSTGDRLPITVCGPATGSAVKVPGDISSQFVSALMMIGPLLPEGLRIEVSGTLVSRSYVEMTSAVMSIFGHSDVDVSSTVVSVGAGGYLPVATVVEPDASSASYPMAIAALTGGTVRIPGLTPTLMQGDASLAEILQSIGCHIEQSLQGCTVTGPASRLAPFDLDMSNISDLVPTMAVLGTQASADCRIRGVGFIRAKESDRLNVLATQLSALGADISETDDGLIIRPSTLHGGSVAVHDDHRMAMAFGVLGTVIDGITIDEPDVVTKSWPSFWEMIEGLRR